MATSKSSVNILNITNKREELHLKKRLSVLEATLSQELVLVDRTKASIKRMLRSMVKCTSDNHPAAKKYLGREQGNRVRLRLPPINMHKVKQRLAKLKTISETEGKKCLKEGQGNEDALGDHIKLEKSDNGKLKCHQVPVLVDRSEAGLQKQPCNPRQRAKKGELTLMEQIELMKKVNNS